LYLNSKTRWLDHLASRKDLSMNEAQKIILQLMRYANNNSLDISSVLPVLIEKLQLTKEETKEIITITEADIREANANQSDYEQINRAMAEMRQHEPYGI
jgi:hypothetical protein